MMIVLLVLCLCFHTLYAWEQQTDKHDEWFSGLDQLIEMERISDDNDNSGGMSRLLSSKDDLIVDFMLYTRLNPENYTLLNPDDPESLNKLDLSKPTKMVIHGWRNGYDSPLGEILKQAYLNKFDVNVIVLDWSSKSFKNYIGSRMSVPKVAVEVASLLDELVKLGLDLDKVHLVGHSLGAHIAGIAGLRIKSGQLSRVTGLDPAAPMFTLTEEDILKPQSAKFVDVIHTCGYVLGFISPLGHADFYPNKGTPAQPGCGFDYKGECSHSRSYELFAESIDSREMLAVHCEDSSAYDEDKCFTEFDPIPMGEHCPPTARGMYFLNTNRNTPFARGKP